MRPVAQSHHFNKNYALEKMDLPSVQADGMTIGQLSDLIELGSKRLLG